MDLLLSAHHSIVGLPCQWCNFRGEGQSRSDKKDFLDWTDFEKAFGGLKGLGSGYHISEKMAVPPGTRVMALSKGDGTIPYSRELVLANDFVDVTISTEKELSMVGMGMFTELLDYPEKEREKFHAVQYRIKLLAKFKQRKGNDPDMPIYWDWVGTMFEDLERTLDAKKQWNRTKESIILRNSNLPRNDPVVDLSLGQPFGSKTVIMIKNSGVDPIVDVAANLRCFLLRKPDDIHPTLFFEGFPSIGNANSWWTIDRMDAGTIQTKDARDSLARCLSNSTALEQSQDIVFPDKILAIDIVYHRRRDSKRYHSSGIARLLKDSKTGEPSLWPVPLSDFYLQMLKSITPPNYRIGPE